MFCETEANHANLCLVDCFRGKIHQSREARPPERPQREARRPLSSTENTADGAYQETRPSQTQFFTPLCVPNHASTNQVTTSLKSSIAVSLLGRRKPTQEISRAIASYPSRCRLNESAAGRGAPGRTRAVARLAGSQRVFHDPVRY